LDGWGRCTVIRHSVKRLLRGGAMRSGSGAAPGFAERGADLQFHRRPGRLPHNGLPHRIITAYPTEELGYTEKKKSEVVEGRTGAERGGGVAGGELGGLVRGAGVRVPDA
jgi:hypothetical protein